MKVAPPARSRRPIWIGLAGALSIAAIASCWEVSHRPRPNPKPTGVPSATISFPDASPADADSHGLSEATRGGTDAGAEVQGERWTDAHRSAVNCEDYKTARWAQTYTDPNGKDRKYGYDGYAFQRVAVRRVIQDIERLHCVSVHYPAGDKSAAGRTVRISDRIDGAWYRLIENTLARLPWLHLQAVHAFVIDDLPILHGVASFSRESPGTDARDGHTIWLNQRLFTHTNHWGPGNYGKYWSYQVQRDGTRVDGQPVDHDLFSPVLIHEIGHIVNYNVVNQRAADPTCPRCAWMCGDHDNCKDLRPAALEAPCATPYCTGFGFSSGTENFAEMYRWFYQSSTTRELLKQHFEACFDLLDDDEDNDGLNGGWEPPWAAGLGEVDYRKSLWDSCNGRACRAY